MLRTLILALLAVSTPPDHPAAPPHPAEAIPIPRIELLYPPPVGTIFDRTCPQFLKTEVKPEWVQETTRRLPEFQALWDKEGPRYLAVTFAEIGHRFRYGEMQAVLTVCPVATMSMPLMINVRNHLSSAEKPAPWEDFAETVFHELMHHYVSPVYAVSALKTKYANEPPTTLYHLHVMALEKLALLKLGKTDELKYLDQLYRTDPPPASYKRAWEIVNDIEGYEAFIKELKTMPEPPSSPKASRSSVDEGRPRHETQNPGIAPRRAPHERQNQRGALLSDAHEAGRERYEPSAPLHTTPRLVRGQLPPWNETRRSTREQLPWPRERLTPRIEQQNPVHGRLLPAHELLNPRREQLPPPRERLNSARELLVARG